MDVKNLWQQVLEELKIEVSRPIFQTLLSQTDLSTLENNIATITCPNPYIQSLVEGRYYSLLKNTLDGKTQKNNSLLFVIKPKAQEKINNSDPGPLFAWQNEGKVYQDKSGLNPKYVFSNLVVGNSNNFAHAAALAIVQNPGQTYNPFFIWGGVGVGKTHLMQAIGHAILSKNPNTQILYCPSESFANDLVSSLQTKTIPSFKKKYRTPEVLLIDDIQFISGKEYIQEEFFHTFNALYLAGRQIVLTSDRRPEEISKIEERLTSRFMGGLTVDIQPPDFEMRMAILKTKSQERGIALSEETVAFLAQMAASNIRELEGTLSQIVTQAAALNRIPDLVFVKNYFGFKSKNRSKHLNPKNIILSVAKHYSLKTSDLTGTSRRKEYVLPRQIVMYLLREEVEAPYMKIGELLGGRDHSTIIHGIRKIENEASLDSNLRQEINNIKQGLYE